MSVIKLLLIFTASVVVLNISVIFATDNIKSLLKEGDDLMARRNLEGYEKALEKYRGALAIEQDNNDCMIKTADALNHMMRAMTNGNTVFIDGKTQDTEKNKSIWAKYGTEAVKLSEAVAKKKPDDPFVQNVYAESYMYYSGSFGIIPAVIKGAAGQYKKNAQTLIRLAPKIDNAVGDIYMGAFYIAAPWPLADLDEARKHIKRVMELSPESLRGHYYTAMIAIKDENYEIAKKELNFVLENPCTMGPEHDCCGFMKEQAKKGLGMIAEMTK